MSFEQEHEKNANMVKTTKNEDFLIKKIIDNLSGCDADDLAGVFDYIYGSKTEVEVSEKEIEYVISYDKTLFSNNFFDGD